MIGALEVSPKDDLSNSLWTFGSEPGGLGILLGKTPGVTKPFISVLSLQKRFLDLLPNTAHYQAAELCRYALAIFKVALRLDYI